MFLKDILQLGVLSLSDKTLNTMEEIDDTLEAIYKKLDRSMALEPEKITLGR